MGRRKSRLRVAIEEYLAAHPEASNEEVQAAMVEQGFKASPNVLKQRLSHARDTLGITDFVLSADEERVTLQLVMDRPLYEAAARRNPRVGQWLARILRGVVDPEQ